jgi:hypothetical protein
MCTRLTTFDVQPCNMHDVMNLIHVAVDAPEDAVHSVQPSTASSLLLRVCQSITTIASDRSCLWKAARGLLKHRIVLSLPCLELRTLLTLVTSSSAENVVVASTTTTVHEEIQILKTMRTMVDVVLSHDDIMESCDRDMCRALEQPHVGEQVQRWLVDMVARSQQEEEVEEEVEVEEEETRKTKVEEHCLTNFLTGANVRRRARETACVWLRAAVLAIKLLQKGRKGEGGDGLLSLIPVCSASALSVVQLLSESDDHLLLLLSTSVEVASCAGGGGARGGLLSFLGPWSPTCLLGHLCTLMGRDATTESLIDILMSPENGGSCFFSLFSFFLSLAFDSQQQCAFFNFVFVLLHARAYHLVRHQNVGNAASHWQVAPEDKTTKHSRY